MRVGVALQCISCIPDAAGLNYTHVTVLNSATERTRRAGRQAGIRIVTNTWDIKFWENFYVGPDSLTVVEIVPLGYNIALCPRANFGPAGAASCKYAPFIHLINPAGAGMT